MTGIIMETKRKLLVSCIVMFIFSSQTVFCKPLVGRCVSFGEDVEMCRGLSHDMTFLLEDQDVGTFFDTVNQNLKTFYEYTVRTNLSCSDNVKFFLCSMHLPKCDPVTFSLSRPCREVCEEVQSECENSLQEAGLWWPKEFTCSILSSKHDSASSCLQGDEVTYDATELNTTSVSKDVQQEVGNGQFSFETNWVESDDRPQFKSYEQNIINNGSDGGVPTIIEYDDTEIVTDNNHVKVDSADKNGKAVYFNYNTQNDTVHVRAQLEFDNVDQDSLGNQEVENGNGEVEVKLDQTLGQHGVGEVQHGSGQSESGQHGSARSQPGSSQLELGQHGSAQSQPGSGQLESGLHGSGQGQHGSGNTIISDSGQSHYSPRPRSPCEPLLSTSSMMCKQFGYTETKMPNFAGHSTVENATKDMSVFISLIQTGCSSQLAFLLCSVYTPACSSRFPEPIPPCRSVCLNVQKECVSILRTFGIVWPADLSCWNFPLASEQTCLQGSADIFRVQPQVRRRNEEKSITQTFYVTANNTVKTGGSSTIASGSRITDHTHGSTKTDSSRGGTVSTGTRQTYSHATDVCSKDKEKGPCSNYTIRWYFDSKQKACLRFWFGGCDPGENNFMTQEECKKTCSGATGSTEHSSGSDHRTGHGSSSGSHSGSVSARCRQNKDRGPCTKYKVNWYYNYNDKRCQRFWYGGCQGNTNRFETEEECKAACSSDVGTTGETDRGTNTATDDRTGTGSTDNTGDRIVDTSDVCRLPSKLGSCRDYKVKWFHNATTRSCGRFWYGGCDGNGNNFDTKEDCEAKCLITVAVPTTTTTSAPLPTTKPGECPRLSVSNIGPCVQNCKEDLECEGNQKCCSNGCGMTCQDPSDSYLLTPPVNLRADMVSSNTAFVTWTDVDAADATERRFYSVRYKPLSADQDNSYTMLNTTAQQVYVTGLKPSQQYEFAVKVIQGTKFSLWSMAAYNKTRAAASYKPGECPAVTGSAGICVEGCSSDNDCGGSMKCCSNGCGHTCRNPVIVEVAPPEKPTGSGTVAQYCSLDAERGPCSNYSVKWHFSPKDGRCTRFWYGGCQGNKNNFASEDECDAACRKSVTVQDVCQLPQVHGPCKAAHRRWYYETSSRDCREFLYGGCRGNENRFMTRAECLIRCGSDETKLKVNGFYAMDKSNNKITLKWDPPVMAKDVRQYRLSYSGERYYRDGIQRDDTSVLDIPGSASSYSINGLKPATQYKFNLTAILGDGRRGPTEYLITNTMSETPEYKQGECPRVEMTEYVNPDCKQLCSTDYDCADNLKCCRDSCGKSCQRPRPRETIRMCYDAQYGCCLDDVTIAQGPNYEGCPDACQTSEFGCCRDGTTPASGPNGDGCEYGSGTDDNFCEQSVYQCCADGITPAQGPNKEGCPEYTTTTQKPVDLGPVCQQPAQRGPCSDYTVKYFYNATSSKCQRFWYGGCQGNQNNFDNSEDCEATCTQKETLPVCQQPKRTGRCRGYFKKFYYNSQSGKCEQFIYGGCDGNDNNFEAEDDCRRKCETGDRITNNRCQLPADVGPCGGSIPRWFFDTRRGECVEFGWGGCEGNLNNFIDKETCLQQCSEKVVIGRNGDVCRMPSETGRCRAAVPRWFYDYNDGICKKFTYGGCEGNQNNFQTKEECQSRCNREYVCRPYEEPTVACLAYFPRYRYIAAKDDCEQFIYGGCLGSSNNFETLAACRGKCQGPVDPPVYDNICALIPEAGRCRGREIKWFFNSTTSRCERFIYGGCDGNPNRFDTLEECDGFCNVDGSGVVTVDVDIGVDSSYCHLPKDVGHCNNNTFPAWYYDHQEGVCKEFVFGGCGGNKNRFTSREVCESSCSRDVVCRLQQETGPCKAKIPRYYYDLRTGRCTKFGYGGCDGNANNFATREACGNKCGDDFSDLEIILPAPFHNPFNPRNVTAIYRNGGVEINWQAPQDVFHQFSHYIIQIKAHNSNWSEISVYIYPPTTSYFTQDVKSDTLYHVRVYAVDGKTYSEPSNEATVSTAVGSGVIMSTLAPSMDKYIPKNVRAVYYNSGINISWEAPSDESRQFTHYVIEMKSLQNDWREIPAYVYPPTTTFLTLDVRPKTEYHIRVYAVDGQAYSKPSNVVTITTVEAYTPDGTTSISPSIPKEQCQQPKDFGNGQGREVMYYYNPAVGDCQPFWYSGAGGNNNRFRNSTRCRTVCRRDYTRVPVVTPRPPVTTTPPTIPSPDPGTDVIITGNECDENSERGPCTNYTVKWFYNRSQGRCTRFWYGGCEGNGNKFDSEAACKARCVEKGPSPTVYPTRAPPQRPCDNTQWGCCPDGVTPALDFYFSNCRVYTGSETADLVDGNATVIIEQPDRSLLIECRGPQGTVAWYKNARILTSDQRFTVFENGSLFIAQLNKDDSGVYACRIDNGQNQPAVRRFRLQIEVPITIFPTPSTIVVRPGENAFLHCQAYGSPQPTVTWTKDGQSIASGGRYYMYQNGTLIISNTQQTDISDYTCTARNGRSSPAQRLVRLSLQESVSASIKPIDGRLREGENLYLACDSRGFPPPTVRWEKMGVELITTGRMTVNGPNLRITDLTLDDTGSYTCVVNNAEDSAKDSKSIQVIPKDVDIPECVDSASVTMCRLIVRAGLCGYTDYSKQCCYSCDQSKLRG